MGTGMGTVCEKLMGTGMGMRSWVPVWVKVGIFTWVGLGVGTCKCSQKTEVLHTAHSVFYYTLA